MTAFDAKTKTMRAATNPATDQRLPAPLGLSWIMIASRIALAGTEGEHCELVHGDSRERIGRNQDCRILRDQTISIDGKHKETIAKDCHQSFIGPQTVTNHTVRNETALAAYTKVWGLATCEENHDGYMSDFPSHYEQYDYSEDRHDADNLYTTYAFSETVVQFQIDFAQVSAGVAQVALNGGEFAAEFSHAELQLVHFEVHQPTEKKIFLAPLQAAAAVAKHLD